jgi:hypothetical protein
MVEVKLLLPSLTTRIEINIQGVPELRKSSITCLSLKISTFRLFYRMFQKISGQVGSEKQKH